MNHSSFASLPVAVFAMAPELAAISWPVESRATCDDCAVGAPRTARSRERPLDQDLRCCTYQPTHPNWLVGRGLRRGGDGAERITRRIAALDDGVSPLGIGPTRTQVEAWRDRGVMALFGQDASMLCPYFLGDAGCSVWRDRGAVCRTWFCKHTDGPRGRDLWVAAARVLRSVERRLAAWCLRTAEPPTERDVDALVAWYIACADRVDAMDPAEALALRDDVVAGRLADLEHAHRAHLPEVPTYLGPSINGIEPRAEGGFLAVAGAHLDHTVLPDGIFELLSRLDGRTPWTEALAEANAALGEERFDASLIELLFRRCLVEERDPDAPEPTPGMSVGSASARQHDAFPDPLGG